MKIIIAKIVALFAFISCSTGLTEGQVIKISDAIGICLKEISANTRYYSELWNIDLYGPILFVDTKSRAVYANFPDTAGVLRQDGEIYSGVLPLNINIANTAVNWGGKSWAMIMLPLPENREERLDLISHELFHRSQPALGFKLDNPSNNHLDMKEGRAYLRLELEALKQAYYAMSDKEKMQNLTNALYFRNLRHSIYPGARDTENLLEMSEGIATYTGIFMSGRSKDQLEEYFRNRIKEFRNNPTFVRSFAYLTIPLYGTILSRSDKYWNKKIKAETNLADFFKESFNLNNPVHPDEQIMNKYGFTEIFNEETRLEERKKQILSGYKLKFIEQPHLEIRLEKMNIAFDPSNLIPLDDYGTVYPTLRLTDNWGILTVSNGAMLGKNWDKITVSEPTLIGTNMVKGDGWEIELSNGYYVHQNSNNKNYSLNKK